MQECFLPHYNERRTPVDMLVLHATCHADADEVFESLDKLELSCHYFVDLNGRITRMVDEQKRAWHAGAGYWQLWYQLRNAEKIGVDDPAELLKIIGYDTRDEEKTIASAYAFRRRFLPQEVAVDPDIKHLVDNVYPIGHRELLQGEKFIRTLKAVAYSYADKS